MPFAEIGGHGERDRLPLPDYHFLDVGNDSASNSSHVKRRHNSIQKKRRLPVPPVLATTYECYGRLVRSTSPTGHDSTGSWLLQHSRRQ